MVHNLQRLIYLCHIKNELNRKRRRFYYLANPRYLTRKCKGGDKCLHVINKTNWTCNGYHSHKDTRKPLMPAMQAMQAYYKAQQEMKAMTRVMREMRVEMGCRFIWNDGGLITHLEMPNGTRLKQESFEKYYEAEIFEMELFDERK